MFLRAWREEGVELCHVQSKGLWRWSQRRCLENIYKALTHWTITERKCGDRFLNKCDKGDGMLLRCGDLPTQPRRVVAVRCNAR